jgi:hypothetical protein
MKQCMYVREKTGRNHAYDVFTLEQQKKDLGHDCPSIYVCVCSYAWHARINFFRTSSSNRAKLLVARNKARGEKPVPGDPSGESTGRGVS